MENKEDTTGSVELFDEIGKNIKEIICTESEEGCTVDLNIITNDGKKYLLHINDLFCIEVIDLNEDDE